MLAIKIGGDGESLKKWVRVSSEQNPYFADYVEGLSNVSLTANKTFYNYDALDRVTSVINPDGTNKTIVFGGFN